MAANESENEIVANTVAELMVILVMLFFLAVGYVFLKKSKAGETEGQTWSPGIEEKLKELGCVASLDSKKRRLRLVGRFANPNRRKQLIELFESESYHLADWGVECVEIVCNELTELAGGNKITPLTRIHVNGHASEIWRGEKRFCHFDVHKRSKYCEDCSDAFNCNLLLSARRAHTVFNACRKQFGDTVFDPGYIESNKKNVDGTQTLVGRTYFKTNNERFEYFFRTGGFSSAEPIADGDSTRVNTHSRRVEFEIRPKRDID